MLASTASYVGYCPPMKSGSGLMFVNNSKKRAHAHNVFAFASVPRAVLLQRRASSPYKDPIPSTLLQCVCVCFNRAEQRVALLSADNAHAHKNK